MSEETKDNAAETMAENVQTADIAEASAKPEGKSELKATEAEVEARLKAARGKAAEQTGALKAVGFEACRRHHLAQVWVTSDGQAFVLEADANAHAVNLTNKEIMKVSAK